MEINAKNLKRMCGLNGFPSVSAFARKIRRKRSTLYIALNNPDQLAPTVRLINKHLPIREVPNAK